MADGDKLIIRLQVNGSVGASLIDGAVATGCALMADTASI